MTEARVTQEVIEPVRLNDEPNLRLSQSAIEVSRLSEGESLRNSHTAIEASRLYLGPLLRNSQIVIEIIRGPGPPDPCQDVEYPHSELPCPIKWDMVPRERRSRSGMPGRPKTRNKWRDRILDIEAAWLYTGDHMEVWNPWFELTLLNGLLWFSMVPPGRDAWIPRVVRYRVNTMKIDRVDREPGRGDPFYILSCAMEQRGHSEDPEVCDA